MRPNRTISWPNLLAALALSVNAATQAQDCNSNGVPDQLDLRATLDFGTPVNYVAAFLPRRHAVGDLDGDNYPEVLVTSRAPVLNPAVFDGFAVLFNRGDGTFAFPVKYDIGDQPIGIALGDFDGLAGLDVAVASKDDDRVYILLNNDGLGSLIHQGTFIYLLGSDLAGIATADFDNLHGADLAILFDDFVRFEFSNGAGSFTGSFQTPVGTSAVAILPANVDNDADEDVIVVNSGSNNVSILINNGNMTFQPAANYAVGASPNAVTAALLDNDAFIDLAVTDSTDDTLTVLLNDGDGTFTLDDTYALPERPSGVSAGDFDDDGDWDLAVTIAIDDVTVILNNNGSGGFTTGTVHPTAQFPGAVNTVDVDLDGDPDLAVINLNASVTVLENDGAGNFPHAADKVLLGNGVIGIVATNLDGDSDPDIAASNMTTNQVTTLRNDGGSFTVVDSFPVGSQPFALTFADFDGSNVTDLATANLAGGSVSVLLNNGDATFALPAAEYAIGTEALDVAAVDFDGDDHPDLVAAYPGVLDTGCNCYVTNGSVVLLENDGFGVFSNVGSLTAGMGAGAIAVGDFSGDQLPDLAVANLDSNNFTLHVANGLGGFLAGVASPFTKAPRDIVAGDFDADGNLDVAVSRFDLLNLIDDATEVFINQGAGTFVSAGTHAGGNSLGIAAADLDDDGDDDLIAADFTDTVAVLQSNGDGTFADTIYYIADPATIGVTTADFDGDNKIDIAAAALNDGNVVILTSDFTPAVSNDCNDNLIPDDCETPEELNHPDCPTCPHTCFDVNGNGDVDLFDFALFALCFQVDPIVGQECVCSDFDGDGAINLFDFARFAMQYGEPVTFVPPNCP